MKEAKNKCYEKMKTDDEGFRKKLCSAKGDEMEALVKQIGGCMKDSKPKDTDREAMKKCMKEKMG